MSKEITALTVPKIDGDPISIAPGAEAHRALLLAQAALIVEVDEFTLDAASDALKLLQETSRAVEKQRTEIKAPVLKLGKDIDSVAKGFTAPIDAEASRLSRLIGGHMAEQQRIVREAEEARQRAIAEAQAAQLKAEEEARKAAATQDADFPVDPPAPKPPAVIPPIPNPVAPAPKIAGIQTRTVWKYEVTDINLLYAARPDLVTLEPNGRAITAAIAADKPIPGLKYWQETSATSRSTN